MDTRCAVACMVKARKMKLKDLGDKLGYKSSGSMSMLLSRRSGLATSKLVEIANLLGYNVVLRPQPGHDGPELILDNK